MGKGALRIRTARGFLTLEWADELFLQMDSECRWVYCRIKDKVIRRTLDGSLLTKRKSEIYYQEEKDSLQVTDKLVDVLEQLKERALSKDYFQFYGLSTSLNEVIAKLEKGRAWCEKEQGGMKAQFHNTYPEQIPLLPPDSYRDVVVYPALGCPNATCTFCDFYRDKPFKVFSKKEFKEHLTRIRLLFGRDFEFRKGYFLGSGNALGLSQKRMCGVLIQLQEELGTKPSGVSSFFDPYYSPLRGVEDWRELKSLGLNRVLIGLETACLEVRKEIHKKEDLSVLTESVIQLKKAKLKVSLTVLIGVGTLKQQIQHILESIQLICALPLEKEDIVYLSPWHQKGNEVRLKGEYKQFHRGLKGKQKARIVLYDVNKFHYFA